MQGKRAITADTTIRLGRYFGTSADFWLNPQKMYELDLAKEALRDNLDKILQ
ncbi:MAG: helix-turn-helix transcriptional regulator [Cyclobacteriaceae bacterium]